MLPETGHRYVHESEPGVPPPPLCLHPHYPFVLIDLLLGQETPSLVTLWNQKDVESREKWVAPWCTLAASKYWAWDECKRLYDYLEQTGDTDIPKALCSAVRVQRPRSLRSQPAKLPRNVLWHEIAMLLEEAGYGRGEAELAIALAVAGDSSRDIEVDSAMRKVRRARKRARELLSTA